ncbi:MAG: rhombosortase [Thalassolituus oleivorans]|nr:rhombosortase [Thalassolituus oleivorans]
MRSVFIFIGLALVCLLIQFSSASFAGGLQFDRVAIGAGQWWRIISGHLVHLSLYHLLLNLCGLALVAYIADHRYPLLTLIAMFWLLLADGLSLYWFAPDLLIYVGLSGALHGALLIAIWYSPFYSRRVVWVTVAIVIGKVLWEQSPMYDDLAMASWLGGRVETRAHLFGVLAGILWIVVAGIQQAVRKEHDSEAR